MKRKILFFNTTGPCYPDDHYMLSPEERLIGAQLHRYIRIYVAHHVKQYLGQLGKNYGAKLIEIKLLRYYDSLEMVMEEGLAQIRGYRDKLDAGIPSYLVIFDLRSEGKNFPGNSASVWKNKATSQFLVVDA